ncbi:MAG: hypothetical protein QNL04_08330, partial [SAR324 cluster bacterium]|nr:hypothetical protein [SAR324 cluster bacterium]
MRDILEFPTFEFDDSDDLDSDDLSTLLGNAIDFVGATQEDLISLMPAKRLEVQLAWTELKNNSWAAKKSSSNVVAFRDVISPLFDSIPDLPGLGSLGVSRLFTFRGEVNDENKLSIYCNVGLPASLQADADDTGISVPKQFGYFQFNSCNGALEVVDEAVELNLADLFNQGISQIIDGFSDMKLDTDRQLQQRGEPSTPDDDPQRPSKLRKILDKGFDLLSLPEIPQHNECDYRVLARHQDQHFFSKIGGFFYQDISRVFFCLPWRKPYKDGASKNSTLGYIFFPFYHPYSCSLIENIQRAGVKGLYQDQYILNEQNRPQPLLFGEMGKPLQLLSDESFFEDSYEPPDSVVLSVDQSLNPIEEFNFSTIGAYSQYNWEIFFHIPLLIASRLSTNQNFREAQHWFHTIFNPTDPSSNSVPEKYWRTRPLVETSQADYSVQDIDQLLLILSNEGENLQELGWAVHRWREDAFNPHLIARSRTLAFQKSVVMKYIDNLIAWGDSLFRRETREFVNEAMQLYILAAKLLGPRPERTPKSQKRAEQSFNQLVPSLDAFSNALVEFENYLPATGTGLGVGRDSLHRYTMVTRGKVDSATLANVDKAYQNLMQSPSMMNVLKPSDKENGLYFCVPANDKLLSKWDLIADRLFKIRHCQNIKGQSLNLSLLDPPIDPAILVRAKAMGLDIDSILGQLYGPQSHYRFQVLSQKASELCSDVKSLGGALLSALEKQDSEALAVLRNTHEARLLTAVKAVKEQQIEESKLGVEGLKHSLEGTTLRRDFYQQQLSEFMNPEERISGALNITSLYLQYVQFGLSLGAAGASLVPNAKGGFVTTLGASFGGDNIKGSLENAGQALGHISSLLSSTGGIISTMG